LGLSLEGMDNFSRRATKGMVEPCRPPVQLLEVIENLQQK